MLERERGIAYIATSEITSLKHEVGDHTMKLRALVSETFLASAKGAKVLYRFRADMIVQDEVDSAFLFCSRESQHRRASFSLLSCLFICASLEGEGGAEGERQRERERVSLALEWLIHFDFGQEKSLRKKDGWCKEG